MNRIWKLNWSHPVKFTAANSCAFPWTCFISGYIPLRPDPILMQSGSIKLTSRLAVFSAVGKTDIPPQMCSSEYWSCHGRVAEAPQSNTRPLDGTIVRSWPNPFLSILSKCPTSQLIWRGGLQSPIATQRKGMLQNCGNVFSPSFSTQTLQPSVSFQSKVQICQIGTFYCCLSHIYQFQFF